MPWANLGLCLLCVDVHLSLNALSRHLVVRRKEAARGVSHGLAPPRGHGLCPWPPLGLPRQPLFSFPFCSLGAGSNKVAGERQADRTASQGHGYKRRRKSGLTGLPEIKLLRGCCVPSSCVSVLAAFRGHPLCSLAEHRNGLPACPLCLELGCRALGCLFKGLEAGAL